MIATILNRWSGPARLGDRVLAFTKVWHALARRDRRFTFVYLGTLLVACPPALTAGCPARRAARRPAAPGRGLERRAGELYLRVSLIHPNQECLSAPPTPGKPPAVLTATELETGLVGGIFLFRHPYLPPPTHTHTSSSLCPALAFVRPANLSMSLNEMGTLRSLGLLASTGVRL